MHMSQILKHDHVEQHFNTLFCIIFLLHMAHTWCPLHPAHLSSRLMVRKLRVRDFEWLIHLSPAGRLSMQGSETWILSDLPVWKSKISWAGLSWRQYRDYIQTYTAIRSSWVALMINNLPANAVYARNSDLISVSERSPVVGNGNPLQYSWLESLMKQKSLVGYSSWGNRE